MDQYLNNRQNEILWNLLADPANNGHLYAYNLQSLVNDFPQSGLLHALLSHAEGGQNISRAAAYVNPKALYRLVNSPESLAAVTDQRIIQQLSDTRNYAKTIGDAELFKDEQVSHLNNFNNAGEQEPAVANETETAAQTVIDEQSDPENELAEHAHAAETRPKNEHNIFAVHRHDAEASEEIETPSDGHAIPGDVYQEIGHVEAKAEHINEPMAAHETVAASHEALDSTEPVANTVYEEQVADDEIIEYGPLADQETEPVSEEHKEAEAIQQEIHQTEAPATDIHQNELLTETATFALAEPPHSIDDEVFDEIVGIENIGFIQNTKPIEQAPVETAPVVDEKGSPAEIFTEPVIQKERALNMDDEAEKLIVGNIAATDYFVFDRALTERKAADPPAEKEISQSANGNANIVPAAKKQDVSKYNDDAMPYTFMWWLNKTRKEHAGVYQPFKLDTTQAIQQQAADELQQQYYENIFHLSSVEELDRSTAFPPVEFDLKTKEDRIIKRFIVEEPHISTPSADKLDNENKAKKSSEDQDEMVTETLARVYIDQMLYHKAINTYKKLILKFPEKSRYFADQIEQLERKTN